MNGCVKVRIKCQKGCGEVLQKCDTLDHQKKCPFRNQRCRYCRKEVQANRTNEHARICLDNPDGVVTCPYKEVACETIEIARKDLNRHITQNMIVHQELLVHELNQLRIGNEQLRTENKELSDKMNKNEFETRNIQTNLLRSNTNTNRSIWILLALVITGMAILIPLLLMERDRIKQNQLSIQTLEQSMKSTIQSIQTHKQSITYPYKEVVCDTIGILRKDLETHITQNTISHQKLVRDFNQLRTGNEQLSNQMDKKESGTTSSLSGIDTTRGRTIWIFLALVIMSIAILLVIRFNQKQKQDNTKKDSELKSIKEILYSYAPLSLPPGQLEWKIKGVEQKIENQEDIYSDPFYVGLYKCQGKIQ